MKKPIAILAASGLIALGGAAATSAASDPATAPAAAAVTAQDGSRETILTDVLKSLVTDGTITQAQADKIVSTLDAKRTALRAERDAARAQMQEFLTDGVITADELAKLPADSPLRNLGSILDDGQITLDELRSLRGAGGFGGRGHGHGFGGPLDGDDAPAASSAPTNTSTS